MSRNDPPQALVAMGDEIEAMSANVHELQLFAADAKDSNLFSDEEVSAIKHAAGQLQQELTVRIEELQRAMHVWQHDITSLEETVAARRAMIDRYAKSLERSETTVMDVLAQGHIAVMKKLEEARAAIGVVPDDNSPDHQARPVGALPDIAESPPRERSPAEPSTCDPAGALELVADREPEPEPEAAVELRPGELRTFTRCERETPAASEHSLTPERSLTPECSGDTAHQ